MLRQSMARFFTLLFLLGLTNPLVFPAAASKNSKAPEPESKLKPFDEAVKDSQKFQGLFTFYLSKSGKVYLEIRPGQLDSLFQITLQISRGIGDQGILSGAPVDDYAFLFHRVYDQVQFIRKNLAFRSDAGTPLSRTTARDFTDSILASLKILSIKEDNQDLLVDAGDLFSSDIPNAARLLNLTLKGAHYSQDASKSSIVQIQAFPLNVEVETQADFSTEAPPEQAAFLDTLPDWRNIPLGIHYSFSSLPQEPYVPRLADDRIGYFTTDIKDFSSKSPDTPVIHYINRWNMAKKPVVFWIENAAPVKYRETIKEAVLEWNKAFAKIGIDHALDVKVQPDSPDWSSADIRHNIIYWISPSQSEFAGEGPSHVNPLTGEIYNASVFIDGETLRSLKYIYENEIGMRGESGLSVPSRFNRAACNLPALKARDARLAALDLSLAAADSEDYQVPDSFLKAYLKDLVMHEVGHCLGLRHNFHASTFLSLKQIQDTSMTRQTGLAASVMDYLPVNLAPPGEKQGDYFSSTIGPYDYWAIEYGYTPTGADRPEFEKKQLNNIAALSTLPGHAYETDEDTFGPYHIDPDSLTFDMSSDNLGFTENRFRLYEKLWREIFRKLPFPGRGFSQERRAFDLVFSGYENFSTLPAVYIGGQHFSRSHRPQTGTPLALVPKSEQMRALRILDRYVFGKQAFDFPPQDLNKLAPDRTADRFSDLTPYTTPFDYPILEKIGGIREEVLDQIFRPVLLRRLLDNEKKAARPQDALTLEDLFGWMTSSFWSELDHGENISAGRRALQNSYLKRLGQLLIRPKPQMFGIPEEEIAPVPVALVPGDAQSAAEYQMEEIAGRIRRALKTPGLDAPTRSHLAAGLRFIHQALNAGFRQSLEP